MLGLIVLLVYTVLAATVFPAWLVSANAGPNASDDHRLDAIANTRGALLGVLAPVVLGIGAVAALLNYRETSTQNRRTLDVTRRGQLTERFTKAIDQLGQTDKDKLDIRLGGIYALEQIAKESEELHRPVMEILTAFLREHSRKPLEASAELVGPAESGQDRTYGRRPPHLGRPGHRREGEVAASTQSDAASNEQPVPLRADFQAIATVLGRREVSHEPDNFVLDLRGVALGLVDFEGAQLQNAIFIGAQLQEADFVAAQLQKAYFAGAQLPAAYFEGAQLQEAYFARADLEGAKFQDGEADEHDALGLTPEQFDLALNVNKAPLPNYLARALKWK